MHYNPAEAIDADQWLSMDEQERLDAVGRWVSNQTGADLDDCVPTAVSVLVVENQIATGEPGVTLATLERLLEAGIDRMTAVLVMSDVMSESVDAVVSQEQHFDLDAFAGALEAIDPAEIKLGDPTENGFSKPASGVPEFSAEHRQVLIDFGERYADDEALSWPELAGFLLAVQAGPDLVMPSEWSEIAQGEAEFADFKEAQAVTEARMALMNWISDCIDRGQPAIPDDCRPSPEPLDILEADNNFSSWCRGVTAGHDWLQNVWDEVLVEDSEDDRAQGSALFMFAFFTDRAMAERAIEVLNRASDGQPQSLEELATTFHPLIEQAAVDYAAVGLANRQTPSAPPPRQPVRSEKIGRNEPCPCGSGKKYKKCCGGPGASHLH